MKTRKRNPQDSIYIYRIATLMALNLLTATAGGLGMLWMRQEISECANNIHNTQLAINDTERRLQYVNVQIAEATSLESLKHRIGELALELRAPSPAQIVHMAAVDATEDAVVLQAESAEPMFVSFELALLKGGASSGN